MSDAKDAAAQIQAEKSDKVLNLKKKRFSRPWEPARRLDVKPKPGFRQKWVSKDLIQKRLGEDWEICRDKHPDLSRLANQDASKLGTSTELPDLILCEMPEERAKERDAYFLGRIKSASKKVDKELNVAVAVAGGKVYEPSKGDEE